MNDNEIVKGLLRRIADSVSWISFWTFLLLCSTCANGCKLNRLLEVMEK